MIFIYILLLIIASNSYAMSERLSRLVQDFDGKIGIHAINLKTKQEIAERADEFFPMASTRKIVLASYIFDLIDKNQLALDSIINIEKKDVVPGSGVIKSYADSFRQYSSRCFNEAWWWPSSD